MPSQPLRVATWNINSLRLRIGLLNDLVIALDPDVICLQETKVPDDLFPGDGPAALGYHHVAFRGMKGYNGVAILSRIPFRRVDFAPDWCAKGDCRHIAVELDTPSGPLELHDFYVPAGGDVPDREANPKYGHKLDFIGETHAWFSARTNLSRAMIVGDLNIAPLEHDVWSHKQLLKVVSHTPIECEKLNAVRDAGAWVDIMRTFVPEPAKLYTWWSYRAADWQAADRGRRLDHIWVSPAVADRVSSMAIARQARGWSQPSDHVPVTATLEL
jgi:exodeoxyribonuclease-3